METGTGAAEQSLQLLLVSIGVGTSAAAASSSGQELCQKEIQLSSKLMLRPPTAAVADRRTGPNCRGSPAKSVGACNG
jgi:hypothetical protein